MARDSLLYRDVQGPEALQTGISQSNAGSAAARLSQAFSSFSDTTAEIGATLRSQQGQQEGASAGKQAKFRHGLSATTAYGEAYNNAALRSYLLEHEADADVTAARLETEAGSDPEKFTATLGEVKKQVMDAADPLARPYLDEAYTKRLTAGAVRIADLRDREIRGQQRVTTSTGVDQAIDRIGRLYRDGDMAGVEAEKARLEATIAGSIASRTFTPAEAEVLSRKAKVGVASQQVLAEFSKEFDKGGDPAAFVEDLKKTFDGSEDFTAEEEDYVLKMVEADWKQRSAEQAAAQAAEVDAHVSAVMDIYDRRGQDAGNALFSNLDLANVPKELQADVRAKLITARNQRREAIRAGRVEDLVDIERAVAQETVDGSTYKKVEDLHHAGAYTEEQYASQMAQLDRTRIKKAGDTAVAVDVQAALDGKVPLAHNDPRVKKAVDAHFSAQTSGLEIGSPEWRATALAYAAKVRMLPPQVATWAESMRRSPNPEVAVPAADLISSVHVTAPEALDGIDEKSRAFADIVSESVTTGGDPVESLAMARKMVYETDDKVAERYRNAYAKEAGTKSDSALQNFIDRDFDKGLFFSEPTAGIEMKAAFEQQAGKYYALTGGDIEKARDLAWRDMRSIYGVSSVNGHNEMMILPPENFGVTPEMVRKEFEDLVTATPQKDGSTAADLILVPDSQTRRAVIDITSGGAKQPSYAVYTKSGQPVTDAKGIPLRYSLPSNEELMQNFEKNRAAAEEAAKADIEAARRRRALEGQAIEYRDRFGVAP